MIRRPGALGAMAAEYVSFIVLLAGLYVVAGGILLRGLGRSRQLRGVEGRGRATSPTTSTFVRRAWRPSSGVQDHREPSRAPGPRRTSGPGRRHGKLGFPPEQPVQPG